MRRALVLGLTVLLAGAANASSANLGLSGFIKLQGGDRHDLLVTIIDDRSAAAPAIDRLELAIGDKRNPRWPVVAAFVVRGGGVVPGGLDRHRCLVNSRTGDFSNGNVLCDKLTLTPQTKGGFVEISVTLEAPLPASCSCTFTARALVPGKPAKLYGPHRLTVPD